MLSVYMPRYQKGSSNGNEDRQGYNRRALDRNGLESKGVTYITTPDIDSASSNHFTSTTAAAACSMFISLHVIVLSLAELNLSPLNIIDIASAVAKHVTGKTLNYRAFQWAQNSPECSDQRAMHFSCLYLQSQFQRIMN